jgi:hypothetical protein
VQVVAEHLQRRNSDEKPSVFKLHPHSILTFCVQVSDLEQGCILVFILNSSSLSRPVIGKVNAAIARSKRVCGRPGAGSVFDFRAHFCQSAFSI